MSAAEFNQAFWVIILLFAVSLLIPLVFGAIVLRALPSPVLDIHEIGFRHYFLRLGLIGGVCLASAFVIYFLKDNVRPFCSFLEDTQFMRRRNPITSGVSIAGIILGSYVLRTQP